MQSAAENLLQGSHGDRGISACAVACKLMMVSQRSLRYHPFRRSPYSQQMSKDVNLLLQAQLPALSLAQLQHLQCWRHLWCSLWSGSGVASAPSHRPWARPCLAMRRCPLLPMQPPWLTEKSPYMEQYRRPFTISLSYGGAFRRVLSSAPMRKAMSHDEKVLCILKPGARGGGLPALGMNTLVLSTSERSRYRMLCGCSCTFEHIGHGPANRWTTSLPK